MATLTAQELQRIIEEEARNAARDLHECGCACPICGNPLSPPDPIGPSQTVGGGYDYEGARKDDGLDDDLVVIDPHSDVFAVTVTDVPAPAEIPTVPRLPDVREEPPTFYDDPYDYEPEFQVPGLADEPYEPQFATDFDAPAPESTEMGYALDDLDSAISQAFELGAETPEYMPEKDVKRPHGSGTSGSDDDDYGGDYADDYDDDLMFDFDMDEGDVDAWNYSKGLGDRRAHVSREEELRDGPGRTTGYTHGDPAAAQDQGWGNMDALPEQNSAVQTWNPEERYAVQITGFADKFDAFKALIALGFGGNIANEVADMGEASPVYVGMFSGERMPQLEEDFRSYGLEFEAGAEGEYWADVEHDYAQYEDGMDEDNEVSSTDAWFNDSMNYEEAADKAAEALEDLGLDVEDAYAHQGLIQVLDDVPVATVERVVKETVPNWVGVDGDPVYVGRVGGKIMVQF